MKRLNYFPAAYDDFHRRFPDLPIIATESSPAFCTRGVFETKPPYGHFDGYDVRKVDMAHCLTVEEAWRAAAARPWVLGVFSWPGFDYHGEPEPLKWPCCATNMGIVDMCGFPKDHFWYFKSWWSDEPVLHIFPHWNWHGRENEDIRVWCYSNCEQVELMLNDVSLGVRDMPRLGHLEWIVPYAPGRLEARGRCRDGSTIVSVRETTGTAAAIRLGAESATIHADNRDVAILSVSATDDRGRAVPTADNRIVFELTGPGRIIGVGNGDPVDHDPESGSSRRLFNGWCQLLVAGTGESGVIHLTATSPGLIPAALDINVMKR